MEINKLPVKIINEYLRTGILSLGEAHGIAENYKFYEEIINQLPTKPNIAVELGYFDKIEFENFRLGKKVNIKNIYRDLFNNGVLCGDGRVSLNFFNFLKKYLDENPNIKIIYLDEKLEDNGEPRDFQMSKQFLNNFQKPVIIIAGNIHTKKNIIKFDNDQIFPMGYYIKNKIGNFPLINIRAASGSFYNFNIKNITIEDDVKISEFIDLGDNNYDFYIEKATPVTLLEG